MQNYSCVSNSNTCNSSINMPAMYDNSQSMPLDCAYRPPHPDHGVAISANYHVPSNMQLAAAVTNAEQFDPHQYNVTSDYQCSALSTNSVQNVGSLQQLQEQTNLISSNCIEDVMKTDLAMIEEYHAKVDIGVQCELGPETLEALLEDEGSMVDSESVKEVEDSSVAIKCKCHPLFL